MLPVKQGRLYDYPHYYELVFGSDWRAELAFLKACFGKHGNGAVRRVFEPACGTGRLLFRLGKEGLAASGNDLNEKMVDYCNARLLRHGLPATVVVGDMADFRLRRKVDAAFNMINSFRHLPTEQAAVAHLECVARALSPGGIYVLGLHLTPTEGEPLEEEHWSARRGNLAVLSRLRTIGRDRRRRTETVGMAFDVYTPKRSFRIAERIVFRSYTARQMSQLIAQVEAFSLAETYDFGYQVERPIKVGPQTEDVVYVLRKDG